MKITILLIACLISGCVGYTIGNHNHKNLLKEVAIVVLRPAYADASATFSTADRVGTRL